MFEMLSVAACARVMVSTQKLVRKGWIPEIHMGWYKGAPPTAEQDKGHSRLDFIPNVLVVLKRKL